MRFSSWIGRCGLIIALGLAFGPAVVAAPATDTDQEARTAELERQIAELRAEIAALRAAPSPTADTAELERRLDLLAAEIERLKVGEAAIVAQESVHGYGPAASKIYRKAQGLSIGGYGEMLLEQPDDTRDNGTASGRRAEIDFLRAVVYFGYKWNDRFLFNSEIEFEHATTGGGTGEASVEFAHVDYLARPELNLRAGLVLVPMGFLNELHEPTVYLGAKRPDVERVILPSTWRENGFGLFGDAGKLSYKAYAITGFKGEGFTAGGLRGGRQKGARALAEDWALVARVDYAPVPGLTFGASGYVGDSGQGVRDAAGEIGAGVTIFEGHGEWRWRGLELRALLTRAELDDVARLNGKLGLTGTASIGERLAGSYLQVGYDVLAGRGDHQLVPYVRIERYDTQDEVPTGFARNGANDVESLTVGLAWKPFEQFVLKADFQDYDNAAGTGVDQFNVSIGYVF
jgi:uncharacterized small protein (DUF1192 family)